MGIGWHIGWALDGKSDGTSDDNLNDTPQIVGSEGSRCGRQILPQPPFGAAAPDLVASYLWKIESAEQGGVGEKKEVQVPSEG